MQAQRWYPNSADCGGRVRLVMTVVGLTDLSVMRLEHSAYGRGTGSGMCARLINEVDACYEPASKRTRTGSFESQAMKQGFEPQLLRDCSCQVE